MNKIIVLATVSAIALSTPAMADMKEAMTNSLKANATTQVETTIGEAQKEMTKTAIKSSIEYHKDYHIKPVLDKDLTIVSEVEEFINDLEIPNGKIWAMPAGDDRTSLMESYPVVMNFVRDKGWRFTGRSHIMAFNTEREV